MEKLLDTTQCPLCFESNDCAITLNEKPETCWCMTITIPEDILYKATNNTASCICPKCASSAQKK